MVTRKASFALPPQMGGPSSCVPEEMTSMQSCLSPCRVAINTSSPKGKCSSVFQLKPLVCRGLRAPECESSSCQTVCMSSCPPSWRSLLDFLLPILPSYPASGTSPMAWVGVCVPAGVPSESSARSLGAHLASCLATQGDPWPGTVG